MADWAKFARIVIEYQGVRAVLEDHGTPFDGERQFWQCDDPSTKRYLDCITSLAILQDELEAPCHLFIDNWAIEAGRLVAKKLGAKIISEEPYKIIRPLPDIDEETGEYYTV